MLIYQIEITNNCNFKCSYCPRQFMTRPLGVMSTETIDILAKKIENKVVRLHHYGESLLFLDRTLYAIDSFKRNGIDTILNTNGYFLDNDKAQSLFGLGLQKIFLSYHNEKSLEFINEIDKEYRSRINILKICDGSDSNEFEKERMTMLKLKSLGYNTEIKNLRDLGQIKKLDFQMFHPDCSFIKNNEVVILWDGTIVPCCECFDNNFTLGNINETKAVENKFFEMCRTCNGYGNDEIETERAEI